MTTALQRPSPGQLTHYSSILFTLYRSHLSGESWGNRRGLGWAPWLWRRQQSPGAAAAQLPQPPHVRLPPVPRAGAVALVVPDHTRDALFQVRPPAAAKSGDPAAPLPPPLATPAPNRPRRPNRLPLLQMLACRSCCATCAPTRPRTGASWRATRVRSCPTPCPAGWCVRAGCVLLPAARPLCCFAAAMLCTPRPAACTRRHAAAATVQLPGTPATAGMPLHPHPHQALASALGFSFSGLVGLACGAVALSVTGVWALMGLAVATGGPRCGAQGGARDRSAAAGRLQNPCRSARWLRPPTQLVPSHPPASAVPPTSPLPQPPLQACSWQA